MAACGRLCLPSAFVLPPSSFTNNTWVKLLLTTYEDEEIDLPLVRTRKLRHLLLQKN